MRSSPNMLFEIDISEDRLREKYSEEFELLLLDHTTKKNIFWATSDYEQHGEGYEYGSQILPDLITGEYGNIITPRVLKGRDTQRGRSKGKAEVFTPSWVCNAQNNLMDNAWFGRDGVFNRECDNHTWEPTKGKIKFPDTEGKTWRDYVSRTCLEITCGEAPYLVSRYDVTTGEYITLENRIGLLDRKLRVVGEHTVNSPQWLKWAYVAFESTYGYEWQGDNLLLARESLFKTFIEYYYAKFARNPKANSLRKVASIISWNLWQMDGLKCVVPNSCREETIIGRTLDGKEEREVRPCPGCQADGISKLENHTGTKCMIMNWNTKTPIQFVDLIKGKNSF